MTFKNLYFFLLLSFCLLASLSSAQLDKIQSVTDIAMVNPIIDQAEPFTYLAKSTTSLAMIAARHGTQVTFDGSLYTGAAELCFFYGEPLRPVMARNKVFAEGWIPIVQYSVQDQELIYRVEAFAYSLDGDPFKAPVNFVRIEIENTGRQKQQANFAVATRFTGQDHRFESMRPYPFSPDWQYEMTDEVLFRDDQAILVYPEDAVREVVPGVPYKEPFAGRRHHITDRSPVGFVFFRPELSRGEKFSRTLKFPFEPVARQDEETLEVLLQARYPAYRNKTVKHWKSAMNRGASLSLSEKKAQEMHQASLMYTWQGIWQNDKREWVQGVNKFQYRGFWLRDGAYITRSHDFWGHNPITRKVLAIYPKYQKENGNFLSWEGQLDGFGQALYTLAHHSLLTQDREYARSIYPHFPKAVSWLEKARAEDPHHIMPATLTHDNELIQGHYTGHNFWALLGVRSAIRLAHMLGETEDEMHFRQVYSDFEKAFFQRLETVCGPDGAIPPGLDVEGGQDWGNLIGIFPSEVMDPWDARVSATLEKMRREKYREGCMSYLGRIHHYLTVKATQNHLARGEQEKTLRDFYAILLHTGSTHEMFEWQAAPWGDRDVAGNFPPHGWGAAMYNLLLRNMLVRESGGNGGLDSRDLHLFSAISPAWAVPGEKIILKDALTELGSISQQLKFTRQGAALRFSPDFHTEPENIIFHIPYFVRLNKYKTNATSSKRVGNTLVFSPDMTRAEFIWTRKEVEPLSYQQAVQEYKEEYRRRFEQYLADGRIPLPVEPPALLSSEQRKDEFEILYTEQNPGIAVGKPARDNGPHDPNHAPALAVDGSLDPQTSCWWSGPYPKWFEIDLEEQYSIDSIRVFPYWDGSRYYRYWVEISPDGEHWTEVADRRNNTTPASPVGDMVRFEPVDTRFIRVNFTYNSANTGAHLVEVRVYETGS